MGGCVRIIFMGSATDGCLCLVTILMGDRESLAGVGLIVSQQVLLHSRRLCMSLIESFGGEFNVTEHGVRLGVCVGVH